MVSQYGQHWGSAHQRRSISDLFAEPGFESNTVTCIKDTRGVDIPELNKELLSRHDCIISDGYGDLKAKTFRIAHMGDLTLDDMKWLLGQIDDILELS